MLNFKTGVRLGPQAHAKIVQHDTVEINAEHERVVAQLVATPMTKSVPLPATDGTVFDPSRRSVQSLSGDLVHGASAYDASKLTLAMHSSPSHLTSPTASADWSFPGSAHSVVHLSTSDLVEEDGSLAWSYPSMQPPAHWCGHVAMNCPCLYHTGHPVVFASSPATSYSSHVDTVPSPTARQSYPWFHPGAKKISSAPHATVTYAMHPHARHSVAGEHWSPWTPTMPMPFVSPVTPIAGHQFGAPWQLGPTSNAATLPRYRASTGTPQGWTPGFPVHHAYTHLTGRCSSVDSTGPAFAMHQCAHSASVAHSQGNSSRSHGSTGSFNRAHAPTSPLRNVDNSPIDNVEQRGPRTFLDKCFRRRREILYKTELCRSWEERGQCEYGSKCQFAHGQEELRFVPRHPKWKTELCRTYWRFGACPYAKRCCFIHELSESKQAQLQNIQVSQKFSLLSRVRTMMAKVTGAGSRTDTQQQQQQQQGLPRIAAIEAAPVQPKSPGRMEKWKSSVKTRFAAGRD